MRCRVGLNLDRAIGLLLVAASLLLTVTPTYADSESIKLKSSSITSEFPRGFRINAQASGDNEITSIAIRIKIGTATRGIFNYLKLTPGEMVDGELFWRTNTGDRYIPPGVAITYNFEIDDSAGNRLETDRQVFIYHDPRYQWEEVSKGPVTISYHGPVKTRADLVLDAIIETLEKMGPILGADTRLPLRVTMYNNELEIIDALPPGSPTIRRELVTEGQASAKIGVLLMIGGGRLAAGTASHEITHILVHRAGASVLGPVPLWLNEGLAEYGNVETLLSYPIALEFAVATDRILRSYGRIYPSSPEDRIIYYGQNRSLVMYMIDGFSSEKMRQLMAALKTGTQIEDAIEQVYGLTMLALDNQWRASIGAPPYVPPERVTAKPTAIPQRTIQLYSLTPQPEAEAIGAKSAEPTPVPRAAPPEGEKKTEATPSGGSCYNPNLGKPAPLDLASVGLLLGLTGLALRRRRERE